MQLAGSIQREINPYVGFQCYEERLQSWGDVVHRLDGDIKGKDGILQSHADHLIVAFGVLAQEHIVTRIVLLTRHRQEAKKQCNQLNCLRGRRSRK